jgi:uncharacterized protein YkwD
MGMSVPLRRLRLAAVAIGLLALGAAPAHAACADSDLMPSQANAAKVRNATLCLLNGQRRAHDLAKLRANGRLRHAATDYSSQMVRDGFFSHVSPSGSTMVSRIKSTNYLAGARSWALGENIAWGTGDLATPRGIVRAWMHSPGHRANILNGGFRDIGIGIADGAPVAIDDAPAGATYTTDFGSRG